MFATEEINKLGKIKKKYPVSITPYEKFKSLPKSEQYLKEGVTFAELDKIAYAESDNDFGKKVMQAKDKLFKKISNNLTK